jgi:glutaconate CoA-transferase subunit B
MPDFSIREQIICTAAHLMADGTTAFVGTGIPMLAGMLAQRTHAPNLVVIFEFGGTGAQLTKLPHGVGDSRTFYRAVAASGICDVMEAAQRGFVEYGFLGAAQIDMYGNLNTTVIGNYWPPKVRLPGSGGANDIGSNCWKVISIMGQHTSKVFVKKLDFLTTPGYLSGPGAREAAGLAPNSGPYRVVSNLGIMGYDEKSKRMTLLETYAGVSVEDVVKNTEFELPVAPSVKTALTPTAQELKLLRDDIDPDKLYR